MSNKLEDFRLESYTERHVLLSALQLYRRRYPKVDKDVDDLTVRLSRTECQPGGCSLCNADRAAEEAEWKYGD